MKKWGVILVVTVLCCGLILSVVCVAGLTFADCWHFEGKTSQDTGAGVRVTLRVDTNIGSNSTGASRCSVYAKSHHPYHLDLGFYTEIVTTVRTAVVQRVTIQYDDGKKVEIIAPEDSKPWGFTKRQTSNWDGEQLVYHESLTAGGTLTNCVDKNMSFVVECEGVLLHETGEEKPMLFRWSFHPKKMRGFVRSAYLDRPEGSAAQYPGP